MFAQVQLRALTGCSRHWRSHLVQWSPQGRCLVGTFLRVWLSCSIQLSFKPDQSHCPSCWKNPQQFWFPPDMRRTLCLHLRRMEVFPYKKKKSLDLWSWSDGWPAGSSQILQTSAIHFSTTTLTPLLDSTWYDFEVLLGKEPGPCRCFCSISLFQKT